jgi:hypothetical protein
MYRFKYGITFAHVCSGNDANSVDKPGSKVGDDVAVEIRE